MNILKDIEYRLEIVWTDLMQTKIYETKSPFMNINLGDDISFPNSNGERATVTSIRHYLSDPDNEIIVNHTLLHVEELIITSDD